MRFGKSVQRDAEKIRRQGSNGNMLFTVHNQAVIDLIGKNDQLMLSGNIHDLLQNLSRIQCTGRVVRIDDHDPFCPVCDLAPDIVHIRIPVGCLITHIMDRMTTCQIGCRRPERIIRRRHQDLISVIQKSLHGHGDQLADSVSRVNIIDPHIRDLLQLAVLHDRFPGRKKTFGIRIAFRFRKIVHHIPDHFLRRRETKGSRVSNIQFQNMDAIRDHPVCFFHYGSPDVIAHVIQFR